MTTKRKSKSKFEAKVKSMTLAELIRAMTKGLRTKWTDVVKMETFGTLAVNGKALCVGCAATNTVCELMGRRFTEKSIGPKYKIDEEGTMSWTGDTRDSFAMQARSIGCNRDFLSAFETIIDWIRSGSITYDDAQDINAKFASIECVAFIPDDTLTLRKAERLPYLNDQYTEDNLLAFDAFADYLDTVTKKEAQNVTTTD